MATHSAFVWYSEDASFVRKIQDVVEAKLPTLRGPAVVIDSFRRVSDGIYMERRQLALASSVRVWFNRVCEDDVHNCKWYVKGVDKGYAAGTG